MRPFARVKQNLQKGNYLIKKCVLAAPWGAAYNKNRNNAYLLVLFLFLLYLSLIHISEPTRP